ncbi:alkene reductase [Cellulophaga baltica]|uniref:alkene reductase n=1 Tax=Cellulophaga baltica TaxID=76594 RepID=UPI0004676C40|nr:alkene reductase [Cellulophaga baltica]|tara:strand:+ start:5909 stop:6994 length:1086 start_codon:yes stop_codon:yes gene_type:complete
MKLLETYQLGKITLKNRVVMAPMTRCRAINNIPNDLMKEYYAQRAGAGLIIAEGIAPSPNALGYARIPGIFNQDQIQGWKKITEAVHEQGSRIFAQFMHTGRASHPDNMPDDAVVLAPSAVYHKGAMWTDQHGNQPFPLAKEMTADDIQNTIEEFVQAAKNAITSGFDGVEIHAGTGFLIDEFINPHTNLRTDEYGGSLEGRMKFALEVTQKIANAIGKEKVGIRISPNGIYNDMIPFEGTDEAFLYLATSLKDMGIAYLHMVDHEAMGAPHVSSTLKEKVKNAFGGTYIASGGFNGETAEHAINNEHGDLVAFGRPFIANPDLVERIRDGKDFAISDPQTHYSATEVGFTDYPTLEKVTA